MAVGIFRCSVFHLCQVSIANMGMGRGICMNFIYSRVSGDRQKQTGARRR
ncbi:hypothetical protein HMPREF9374_3998 [Desmospora sp. 8437]|nr:hypothetical protein HMPREF9374_3998 [Desmospora sp. 8437]